MTLPTPPEMDLPQTNEERLELTQRMRLRVINAITADGTKIPHSPDDAKLLLEALNDMDRTTLGSMKQKSDDTATARDRLVAEALATLGRQIGSASTLRVDDPVANAKPVLVDDSLLPEISVVPGETDIGVQQVTYSELAARFGRSRPALLEHDSD